MNKRNETILSDLPELIQDLKRAIGNRRVKIVLVKANICQMLEAVLKAVGFNLINAGTVIPFAAAGNQNKFHKNIKKVLRETNIR